MRARRAFGLFVAAAMALVACAEGERSDAVAVRVGGIALDASVDAPVVILEEVDGSRRLPIWIGVAEARSILAGLHEREPVRPNSHDMARRLVEDLEARVERVVVRALENGIYYADLVLVAKGHELRIDARPSDAIALAVRVDAPVFVLAPLFEAEALEGELSGEGRRIHLAPPGSTPRQLPLRSL